MQTGENAIIITFAQRIVPWLSIGANFKILRYDLPITQSDQISGTGLGFDIGLLVKTGGSTFKAVCDEVTSCGWDWTEIGIDDIDIAIDDLLLLQTIQ